MQRARQGPRYPGWQARHSMTLSSRGSHGGRMTVCSVKQALPDGLPTVPLMLAPALPAGRQDEPAHGPAAECVHKGVRGGVVCRRLTRVYAALATPCAALCPLERHPVLSCPCAGVDSGLILPCAVGDTIRVRGPFGEFTYLGSGRFT